MNAGQDPAFALGRFGHQLTFGLRPGTGDPFPITAALGTYSLDVGTARVQANQAATCRVHCVNVAALRNFGQQSSL